MSYSYLTQPVLTSELCFQRDADSFFSPVTLKHTGYAYDGFQYTAGVQGTGVASWFSEGTSATRGILLEFPTQALVLVSRASLSILDATTTALNLWMLFYLADTFGFSDNPEGTISGYLASAVTWNSGVLSVTMSPDAGSAITAPNIISFDFVLDSVYLDTHIPPS